MHRERWEGEKSVRMRTVFPIYSSRPVDLALLCQVVIEVMGVLGEREKCVGDGGRRPSGHCWRHPEIKGGNTGGGWNKSDFPAGVKEGL
jgi:hypothetical protein